MSACLATGIRGASIEGSTYDVTSTLGGTSGAQEMPHPSLLSGDLTLMNVLFTYLTCTDQPVLRGLSTTGRMRRTRWSTGVWQVDSRCDGCMNPRRAGSLLAERNLAMRTSTASRSTSQQPNLFDRGSGRMIAFGATMSDAVECASSIASMHEFALGLLQGYVTTMENGSLLSGGQVQ